jgi:hypothetical protein
MGHKSLESGNRVLKGMRKMEINHLEVVKAFLVLLALFYCLIAAFKI